jgi:hypothetical protein
MYKWKLDPDQSVDNYFFSILYFSANALMSAISNTCFGYSFVAELIMAIPVRRA